MTAIPEPTVDVSAEEIGAAIIELRDERNRHAERVLDLETCLRVARTEIEFLTRDRDEWKAAVGELTRQRDEANAAAGERA